MQTTQWRTAAEKFSRCCGQRSAPPSLAFPCGTDRRRDSGRAVVRWLRMAADRAAAQRRGSSASAGAWFVRGGPQHLAGRRRPRPRRVCRFRQRGRTAAPLPTNVVTFTPRPVRSAVEVAVAAARRGPPPRAREGRRFAALVATRATRNSCGGRAGSASATAAEASATTRSGSRPRCRPRARPDRPGSHCGRSRPADGDVAVPVGRAEERR